MKQFTDYEYETYFEEDSTWKQYFKHLYPTKYEMHTIMNRRVVENLKSNQAAEVMVTDMSGKTIWRQQYKGFGKHQHEFDLQGFAPGIYLAFARSNGKIWGTRKFVVTN